MLRRVSGPLCAVALGTSILFPNSLDAQDPHSGDRIEFVESLVQFDQPEGTLPPVEVRPPEVTEPGPGALGESEAFGGFDASDQLSSDAFPSLYEW